MTAKLKFLGDRLLHEIGAYEREVDRHRTEAEVTGSDASSRASSVMATGVMSDEQ